MLNVHVTRRLGEFALDVALSARERTTVVLVGESGSGKTSFLRLLAGLLRPDRGRIEINGDVWFDSDATTDVPPAERAVGYVAQDYALFPHLTVAENAAFGLRAQHLPARDVAARAESALERLGIGALRARRPHELSGGQQQRVAIARAIVLEPRLLMLDEPLSALDVQNRRAIRGELRRLLATLQCTTLYVTHSPAEALAVAGEITVLEAGRVSQSGSREELMRRPRSPFVAEFLGVNLFRGTVARREADGLALVRSPQGEVAVADPEASGEIAVIVHPREITLALERPAGSARNVLDGVVEEIVPEPPSGEIVRVSLATRPPLVAEVTRQSIAALGLRPGLRVFASFKATGVTVIQ